MSPLNTIETLTLLAIQDYLANHDNGPTYADLADLTGRSISATQIAVKTLTARGYVSQDRYKWRSIRLVDRKRTDPILIVPATRPEMDTTDLPTYHELLTYLCDELSVPGAPSFREAVQWVKQRLEGDR